MLCCVYVTAVSAQSPLSRAEEAVRLDDANGLKTCLLSEGGRVLTESEKLRLLDTASESGHSGTYVSARICTCDVT